MCFIFIFLFLNDFFFCFCFAVGYCEYQKVIAIAEQGGEVPPPLKGQKRLKKTEKAENLQIIAEKP